MNTELDRYQRQKRPDTDAAQLYCCNRDRSLRLKRSEAELVDLARRGDADAFGELYRLHLDAIYHYISKRVGERCEVEDLTQTVFLKAWQALEGYQPSAVPFRGWLYRIAHNKVVDHYRTQKGLFRTFRESYGLARARTLSRSRSNLARPYIWRLISFSRVT
jgi:DNA-directed RNA polymerase specialized sigma24 family protein